MNLIQETKFIMNKYNITANKNYGQNFLIDELSLQKIIETASVSKEDLIIEIGPGLGNLTSILLENAGKVICIEIDTKMINILNDRFGLYNNFELINEDILKIDINELINKNLSLSANFKNVKIVANLPYYITTPIIMKLLENKPNINYITIMVQKEVAERLTSIPGTGKEIGAITYSIHYYTNPKYIYTVNKECFIPIPKVDSAIINLEVLKKAKVIVKDEELFFKIIKSAFMQKRKTLINSLTNANIIEKSLLEKIMNDLNLDLKIRAEKLSLEQFASLGTAIFDTKYAKRDGEN